MLAASQFAYVGLAAGGVSLTQVTFLDAGSGAIEVPVSGTFQVPFPATVAAGNFLVLHIYLQDTTAPAVTTPSGWTAITSETGSVLQGHTFYKIATGAESGNLDVTCTADTFVAGRIYRFSHGSGVEGAASARLNPSNATMTCVAVTTLGVLRCAVQLFGANVNTTIGSVTGETNADYTEAVAEYATASGPVIISCQTASIAAAVAITGGTATLGTAGAFRIRHGFAITP